MDRSRATNFLVVLAAIALIMNLTPTAPANAVTACTLNQLVPQVSDTSVIQGVGASNGTGGYATLARGKETLVRFYLTLPSASLCTVGSTQSIKVTSASLTVDNRTDRLFTGIAAYNAFGTGQLVGATMQVDSAADPLFVVPSADLAPGDGSTGFTATFTATINYTSKSGTSTASGTLAPGPSKTASFDKKTNALRILVVPMGDASQTYSTQFSAAAQTAVQNAMTALSRLYPVTPTTGELTSTTGGIRYTINLAAMVDLKAVSGAYDSGGKFCGAQTNFDAIKGQLSQFLLSWNTLYPAPSPSFADRVLGVVDSNISDGSSLGCSEGFAAINGVQGWIRAIPDQPAVGRTPAQPSMSGGLAGMELSHTFGLVPLSRPNSIGYHAGSVDQYVDANGTRAYNVSSRSLDAKNRNVMRLDTTVPWNNNTVLLGVQDYADLVCFLGGTATTECTSNPTAGTSTGVAAGQATFAMSGTTDGSSAANTHVVESYVAAGVAQTREPSTATGYFLDEYVGGTKTATRNVAVNFAGTHHDSTDPGILAGGDVGIGVFAFAYPSDLGTDLAVTRVVLRKDTIVLYDRSGQANAPTLGSVTATSGGIPGNFTNTNNQSESAPAISPDGQWIAYASSQAIGGTRILVAPIDGHRSAVPVPAGPNPRIAFTSDRSGNDEIWTSRLDGTGLQQITNNAVRDFHPRFSPDGSRIAFVRGATGSEEIYVINANGSSESRLTTNELLDGYPSWSPDGTKILFEEGAVGPGCCGLFTMNPDGTGTTQVIGANAADPAWSPLGNRIAFARIVTGTSTTYEIWTANTDGSGQTQLTTGSSDREPAWSPDGSKIAFTSQRDGHNEIYVMNSNGSGQVRITDVTDGYRDHLPWWSPDGTQIGFSGAASAEAEDLFIMYPDGKGRTNITGTCCTSVAHSYNFDWDPTGGPQANGTSAWRPDGHELAFVNGREILRVTVNASSGTPIFGAPQSVFAASIGSEAEPGHPTYSPDGGSLAFDLSGDIMRIPVTGGTPTQLTSPSTRATNEYDRWPSWSRTAGDSRIVFVRESFAVCAVPCGGTALYLLDVSGAAPTASPLVGNGDLPSWGTSGRIAFTRLPTTDSGFPCTNCSQSELWSISPSGSTPLRLTSGNVDQAPSLVEPRLAFDRFVGFIEGGQNEIFLLSLDSTRQTVVALASGDHPELFTADLVLDCTSRHYPANVGVPSNQIDQTTAKFTFNFDQSLACGGGAPTLSVYVSNGVQRGGPTGSNPPINVSSPTPKGPRAAIYNPIDATAFCLTCRLPLNGSGKDAENGELTGTSLQWFITPPGGTKTGLGGGSALDAAAPPSGWTGGLNTITLEATDADGNIARATITIMVTFDFSAGFLPPVNNAPVVNTGKGGRTYPIKFQLPKPDGTFYSSLSLVSSITVQQVVCGSFGTALTDPLETTATGGTTLRYDSGVDQYIYNWQTPGPGCYLLTVNLSDGTQHQAEFSLN